MAYYSDMAVEMKQAKYLELLKSVRKIRIVSTKKDVFNLLRTAAVKKSLDKKWIALKWTQINWNIHRADIEFLDKFFDDMVEQESPNDFRIIRIGEDYDDIEIFGASGFCLSLTREIRM